MNDIIFKTHFKSFGNIITDIMVCYRYEIGNRNCKLKTLFANITVFYINLYNNRIEEKLNK